MIHASAPGKLILFGEHVGRHGKPVVVFAINRRLNVYITPLDENKILMTSEDLGAREEAYPSRKLDMVSGAIKAFFERTGSNGKFRIETKADIRGGFGSSGAAIVSTLGALDAYFGTGLTKGEMLRIGLEVEREVSGVGSGIDIASALWGGMILYQKGADVKPIKYKEFPIVVGNTGFKAKSKPIVDEVTRLEKKYPAIFKSVIENIGDIAMEAVVALEKNDLQRVGELMNVNHGLLYAEGVSSIELERLVWAARSAGAIGAKLSGAGKGDNMLALSPAKIDNVRTAIKKAGGIVEDLSVEPQGLTIHTA